MRLSTTILSPKQLHDYLGESGLVIIDSRFELSDPSWGFSEYQQGHIPGAVYADMNKDLSGKVTPQTGRHPLPDPEDFIRKAGEWGINLRKQVVVYDQDGGAYASRLWWLLRTYGHEAVAVLDGGLPAWIEGGYPLSTRAESPHPVEFEGIPDPNQWVTTKEMESLLNDPSFIFIDSRSPERFRGEIEPVDQVAGHIPGAINRYYGDNLSSDGLLLLKDQLNQAFSDLLGELSPDRIVTYCGSGVTSCHHLLAMEIAGLYGAKLYVGSWSEWIRDPSRPIMTGG